MRVGLGLGLFGAQHDLNTSQTSRHISHVLCLKGKWSPYNSGDLEPLSAKPRQKNPKVKDPVSEIAAVQVVNCDINASHS